MPKPPPNNQSPYIVDSDLTTKQAAGILHLRPQTLRKALSKNGSYFGVRPRKAANLRLFWNAAEINNLKNANGAQKGEAA